MGSPRTPISKAPSHAQVRTTESPLGVAVPLLCLLIRAAQGECAQRREPSFHRVTPTSPQIRDSTDLRTAPPNSRAQEGRAPRPGMKVRQQTQSPRPAAPGQPAPAWKARGRGGGAVRRAARGPAPRAREGAGPAQDPLSRLLTYQRAARPRPAPAPPPGTAHPRPELQALSGEERGAGAGSRPCGPRPSGSPLSRVRRASPGAAGTAPVRIWGAACSCAGSLPRRPRAPALQERRCPVRRARDSASCRHSSAACTGDRGRGTGAGQAWPCP